MKHHLRRRRNAPQNIDFIVIGGMRTDKRAVSRKRGVYVQMSKHGGRRMIQVLRVNVVKRRL